MWPMYVDYTDDECKKVLRSLELEAYASVINAFRAQGSLSKERKKMLQELCTMLSITLERHRAEIRRAVNDEHLNTIAERLAGPNTSTEWAIEGRRLVPLMPRIVPQTVFTAIANSVATAQAAKNATLPMPGKTGMRENSENDIIETMMSRKRKEPPTDITASPSKYAAIDNQCGNISCNFETSFLPETLQSLNESSISDCSTISISSTTQLAAPLEEFNPIKSSLLSSGTTNTSPIRSPSKHSMSRPASTVTTFSSFEQLTSNVISSKTISSSFMSGIAHEEQVSTSEAKSMSDIQAISRLSQSSCTVKSPSVTSINSTNSSTPTDKLPVVSSSPSSGSKFLTQATKLKPSTHMKQAPPTGLGLKTNSSSLIGQRSVSPKSSITTKAKVEPATSLTSFLKKQASINVQSSESAVTVPSSHLPNESLTTLKSLPVTTKTGVTKSECSSNQSILQSQPATTKVTTLPKTFHKTATGSQQQFVARTLFSSGPATKTGSGKNLPPVIFNVSTSTGSQIQSSAKTTVPGQSDATKVTTPQLMPKSTTSIGSNQFKLSTSNAPTIQYRNEGGMVRSARIVNISQPVGSRLPCAISPSAISALGLSSSITSTALRVTLPAGTLNTSSALRVSAAAKPNVIVVHKAQMWPRSQGAAAVIMSSSGSLPRLSNDVMQETLALSQKQDKGRQGANKITPRSLAPSNSQTPNTVISASMKAPDVNSLAALSTKGLQPDNIVQPDSSSTKLADIAECKRNLLADVIEASGIMMEGSPEKNSKKVLELQSNDGHRLKPVAEPRNNKTTEDTNTVTTSNSEDVTSSALTQGMNADKLEKIRAASPSLSMLAMKNSDADIKVTDPTQDSSLHPTTKARKPCDIFASRIQDTRHSPACEPETKQKTAETN